MICYTNKHKIPFQIDEEDYKRVKLFKWHVQSGRVKCKYLECSLHVFIMGPAPNGLEWDHIDRDPLNCQKKNLRAVTHRINMINVGLRKDNTSGYRGIHRNNDWWRSTLATEHGNYYLGQYRTKEEAVKARQDKEKELGLL